MRRLLSVSLVVIVLFIAGCGAGGGIELNKAESARDFTVIYSDKWEQGPDSDDDVIELVLKESEQPVRIIVRRLFDAKEITWDNLIKPLTGKGWSVFLLNRRDDGRARWFGYRAEPAETTGKPVTGFFVVKKFPQSWLMLNLETTGEIDGELQKEFTELVGRAKTM